MNDSPLITYVRQYDVCASNIKDKARIKPRQHICISYSVVVIKYMRKLNILKIGQLKESLLFGLYEKKLRCATNNKRSESKR